MIDIRQLEGAVGSQHVVARDQNVSVAPGSAAELGEVLRIARGSTRGIGFDARHPIQIDLHRMCNVLHFDEASLLVTVQAGIRFSALEAVLEARGLTLGPLAAASRQRQVGALLAAPRLSEARPRLGRFVQQCAGLSGLLADGTEVVTRVAPRKATGPDLMHLFLGARGRLGLITDATLRIERRGDERRLLAWRFDRLEGAIDCARSVAAADARPADLAVTAVPEPQLTLLLDGPPLLVEVEQRLADERAQSCGGRATEPAVFPAIEVPARERALAMEALDWPAAERDAQHLLAGFHASGAALIDRARAAETSELEPLIALLKTELDPGGLLPADSPHA